MIILELYSTEMAGPKFNLSLSSNLLHPCPYLRVGVS